MKTKELKKSWLFDYSNPQIVFILGIIGLFVLILASTLTGTQFRGIFLAGFIEEQSLTGGIKENLLNVLILGAIYGLLARYINRDVNLIQIMNAVLISRIPFLILMLFNINDFIRLIWIINTSKFRYELYDFTLGDSVVLILFGLFGLLVVVYSVRLLYRGFSSATGMNNRKGKYMFFGALFLAELISKGII